MAQKRFVFDDEKETVQTQQSLSQIDQYENYKHSEEKKIIDKKETISKIDINNWIICFDDLERCYLSINEILGYINRLVEHNNCKVVILANEKEIGKINLNQRLENKYQVVMSGRKLNLENESNEDENLDIKKLQSMFWQVQDSRQSQQQQLLRKRFR